MRHILPTAATCLIISAKRNKRDECDQAIKRVPEMAFCFSAVAAVESKVKKNHINGDTEEEGDLNNTNHEQEVVNWPAISY